MMAALHAVTGVSLVTCGFAIAWASFVCGLVLLYQAVEVELGPIERHGMGGPGVSVYFRDPDGSLLEFISYV